MDDREKVALVARAIERAFVGMDCELVSYEPGLFEEAARQAIAAYMNAWRTTEPRMLDAQRIPDGWVCVPREPTRRMKSAAVMDADDEWNFGPHEARECWHAMIDAALTAPESAGSARQSDAGSISTEPQ
jgi:hypothetical protein